MPWGQGPPAWNDRHCMFPTLVVVAVLQLLQFFFYFWRSNRVIVVAFSNELKDSG